jgi:Mg2+/Co2+ transporter CorB
MVSSAKETLNYLKEKFEMSNQEKREKRSHSGKGQQNWSAEELETLLHIVRDQAQQVEGNMLFSLLGMEKMLTFDNHTLDKLPQRM